MAPSQRITATAVDIILTRAADVLDADEHCGLASEVRDVRSVVAGWAPNGATGGEMPEPWPGLLVEDEDGERWAVGEVYPKGNGIYGVRDSHHSMTWNADNIREVRTADGRVLWRKE